MDEFTTKRIVGVRHTVRTYVLFSEMQVQQDGTEYEKEKEYLAEEYTISSEDAMRLKK